MKKKRLAQLLSENCNFVDDFNSSQIPLDAVFVFGRKAPCNTAENLMIQRMKNIHSNNYVTAYVFDEQSTTAGNWRPASTPTTNRLSRVVKQREELIIYPKARFEFVYNGEKDIFLQGQLAICLHVPSRQIIEEKQNLKKGEYQTKQRCFDIDTKLNKTQAVRTIV